MTRQQRNGIFFLVVAWATVFGLLWVIDALTQLPKGP